MEYFVEQAPTHRDALEKVRRKYGDSAKVMHYKTVRIGGFLGLFGREGVEVTGYFSRGPQNREAAGRDGLGSRPARQDAAGGTGGSPAPGSATDFEEEKRKILGTVKNDGKTLDLLLKEVQGLKTKLEEREQAVPASATETDHETIDHVQQLLEKNEFSLSFSRQILSRLRREFALEALEDRDEVEASVVEWIGEAIPVRVHELGGRPHVFVLVGPTGVGKTTTIAKLAAMWGFGSAATSAADVRILTIDNYRIGARTQIETFGDIMGIPVHCVESYADLEKQIALYRDVDVVFVDTIGKSPRDSARIGEMKELLSACGQSMETHLAVSATTKTSDLGEIVQQFEPFGCTGLVATKLDETTKVGNLISALAEKQKPLVYVTDGQRVPQDIEPASVVKLLLHLEGFRIDRERLERRFGDGD